MATGTRTRFAEYSHLIDRGTIAEQCSALGRFMEGSSGRIVALALVRYPSWLFYRYLGLGVSPTVFAYLIVCLPSAVAVWEVWQRQADWWQVVAAIAGVSVVVCMLIIFPRYAWLRLIAISDHIDDLFEDETDRAAYIEAVKSRLRMRRQLPYSLATAAIAIIGINIIESYFWDNRILISQVIVATLIGFLGGNAVYWLWAVPGFVLRLCRMQRLRLSILSPAYTPALLALSRLLATSALLAMVGASSIVIPLALYGVFYASGLGAITIVIVATGSLATVAFVGLAPQLALARVARRHKERILDEISRELRAYRSGLTEFETETFETQRRLALLLTFNQLVRAPNMVIQPEVALKYVAAFMAPAGPLLLILLK